MQIDAALACLTEIDSGSEVVAACLGVVASDLRKLFELYRTKVRWIMHEQKMKDLFKDWNETDRNHVLSDVKNAYESRWV